MRRATIFLAALVGLHLFACVPQLSVDPRLATLRLPSPDLLLALAVALLGATAGRGRIGAHAGAVLMLVGVVYGVILEQWPVNFDAQFRFADLPRIEGLPHLLLDHRPEWQQWTAKIAIVPALLAVHLLLAYGLRRLARAGGTRGAAAWLAIGQTAVVLGIAAAPAAIWRPFALLHLVVDTAVEVRARLASGGDAVELDFPREAARLAAAPADLAGLDRADVHVVFIESYGRVALRHPGLGARLRTLWPELERELATAGFAAASGAIAPAVSGGGSSLAHAEFLTAVRISDYGHVERLLHSGVRPLPRLFADAGYRTVLLMPSMNTNWTQGMSFYGFQQGLSQQELGYSGHRYHFGAMPDQFALARLLHTVIEPAPAAAPMFTFFVSVTSHLPCTDIPPYLADWAFDPAAFPPQPEHTYSTSWFDYRTNPETPQAYGDAVAYSMRTAVGFASQLTRPSIVIVLGDHQPPIKSLLVADDNTLDVPLHVMSNRPELLARFAALGLTPGLDVPDGATSFESATFAPRFLELFSRR